MNKSENGNDNYYLNAFLTDLIVSSENIGLSEPESTVWAQESV